MLARGSPPKAPQSARTRAILRAVRTGRVYEDIGREFGVTGACIRKTAARFGLPNRIPLPRVTIACAHCGKQVVTPSTQPRKFCSKRCFYLNRRGTHRPFRRTPEAHALWIASRTRICQNCGKTFLVKFARLAGQYCGHKCSGQARAKLKPQDLVALKVALKTMRPRGQIAARFGVTRQYIQQLAVRWHIPWPGRLAARARSLAARTRTCESCGKKFLVRFLTAKTRFCSHKCVGQAQAKRARPRLRAIRAALKTQRPRRQIAAQFGVSPVYVFKLARRWRIPPLRKTARRAK